MENVTTNPTKRAKTKFQKFLVENKVIARDLEAYTIKVDLDKYGIKINHIYLISNGHISPNVNTMVIIARALSVMLNKNVTLNDIIDY